MLKMINFQVYRKIIIVVLIMDHPLFLQYKKKEILHNQYLNQNFFHLFLLQQKGLLKLPLNTNNKISSADLMNMKMNVMMNVLLRQIQIYNLSTIILNLLLAMLYQLIRLGTLYGGIRVSI